MSAPTPDAVRAALAGVPDPELPALSVLDLGIVAAVRVEGAAVEVDLVPTFTGCPATQVIRDEVEAALRAMPGVADARVRWVTAPVWSPARISAEGRTALKAFGVSMDAGCPHCDSARTDQESAFGPTPCRALRFCEDCRNSFEVMK
ncbi:MAG TPA: 1,2-phenylacetyl-CoA epoxidase subunit PaaD [Egibacteraceae bacterium]|nr:1,2-phenylacetyl-CoA epoxidase subunit PaaD [Egibacteraceae bacterium]